MKICPRSQIFLRCVWADPDLIINVERFAWIDRIYQIYDYERNQYSSEKPAKNTPYTLSINVCRLLADSERMQNSDRKSISNSSFTEISYVPRFSSETLALYKPHTYLLNLEPD